MREREFHEQSLAANGARVRDAVESDMEAIQTLYAQHVLRGLATFEETPPSATELRSRWRAVLQLGLPYLVAERDGAVAGFSYAGRYRDRSAYRFTIEDSVYVAEGAGGRGIGGALLRELVSRCEAGPWRQMIAVIGDSSNTASVALHRSCGFASVGTLASVGFKHGRWVDVVLMQRPLGAGGRSNPVG